MCFTCEVISKQERVYNVPESQVVHSVIGEEQIGLPTFKFKVDCDGIDKLAKGVSNVSDQLGNIADGIDPLFDKFNNLLGGEGVSSSLLSNLKRNAHMICFNLFSISRANTIPEFIGGGVNLFANLGFDRILVNKLTEWFSNSQFGVEQSFENTQKLLLLALTTFSSLSPSGFLEKFNLSQNMKEMEAMNKLFDLIASVLGECGIDISAKARNLRKLRETLSSVISDLPEFEFDMIHHQTKFLKNSYYSRFTKMKASIDDLRRDVSTHAYSELRNSTFAAELMEVFRRVKAMSEQVESIRREAKSRPKPQAFLFAGVSQIGKTELVLEIVKRIKNNKRSSPLCQDMEFWREWNHNATDAYHQGYIGQEIHVVDDIFQRTDHVDHADMINFISSNPYLTRQPDLASKGRPYFSRLVLASVNNLPTSSKAIETMDALKNRFTIIDCECPGVPPRGSSVIDKDFPHLTFKIGGWDKRHCNISTPISLDEIVDTILDELENAESFYNSREDEFSDAIGEEQIGYFPNSLKPIFSDSLFGFLKELKEHDREMYLKLRKIKITFGEREIRAVDYISQLDIQYTYQFLDKLFQQGVLPAGDLYFGYNAKVYHWIGSTIAETDVNYIPTDRNGIIDQDDFEQFNIPFIEMCKERFQKFYWTKWKNISEMFRGYRSAGIFASGFISTPLLICAVLLANFSDLLPGLGMRWRLNGLDNNESRDDFWFTALGFTFDIASLTLTTGIFAYIIYKFYTLLSNRNTTFNCKQCEEWYRESLYSDLLEESCKINCKGEQSYSCLLNKASLRLECEACKDHKCSGDCLHSRNFDDAELHASYLRLLDFAVEEVSPEGKRLTLPKMKRLMKYRLEESSQEEISPEGKRLTEPKMKRLFKHRLEEEDNLTLRDAKRIRSVVNKVIDETKESNISLKAQVVSEEGIIGYSVSGSAIGSNEIPLKARRAKLENKEEALLAQVESCVDEGCKNILASLCNITVRVCRENSLKNLRGGLYGLGFGKYIVTPQHLHVSGDPNFIYYAVIDGDKIPLKFVKENINMDVALWELPHIKFNMKMLKHLMTNDEFEKHITRRIAGYQYIPNEAPYGLIQNVVIDYKCSKTNFTLVPKGSKVLEKSLVIEATHTTAPLTSKGDCGGFIVVENPMIPKKLIGFHVVGAGRTAYSAILTIDLINSLMPSEECDSSPISARLESDIGEIDDIEYKVIDSSAGELIDVLGLIQYADENQTYMPEGDFEYIGDISYPKPQKVTQLKEHPFKHLFECTVRPAALDYSQVDEEFVGLIPLNKKGIPDLLMMKAAKYGLPPPKLEPRYSKLIESLQQTVVEHTVTVLSEDDVSPCSWDEAVGGDPNDPFSHKLKGQTSAGIGWDRSATGAPIKKSSYFTQTVPARIDETTAHGKKLMDTLVTTEKLMANGYRTLSIDKNCLKDEPRPFAKAWKPRLFKARPLDKVILKRKYFLKYKVAWTKAGLNLNHAVGINPLSGQWANLYYHLASCNDKGFDADFGGFDTNQLAVFQRLANRIKIQTMIELCNKRGKPLTQKQINVMRLLLEESVESLSSVYSNVVLDKHGNSSGDPNTTEDNTEVNDLYHFFCFVVIMAENKFGRDWTFEQAFEFVDYQLYRKYVKAIFFGDDLLIVADPEIQFTFARVQNIMVSVLQQDYTSAHKDKEGHEKPITELTFLKRNFKIASPTFIIAPIEKASIEQRFCYTMVDSMDIESHALLIKEGLLEACCHGPTYYNELREKLKAGVSLMRWKDHPSMCGVFLNYTAMKSEYFTRYNEGSF